MLENNEYSLRVICPPGNKTLDRFIATIQKSELTIEDQRTAISGLHRQATLQFERDGDHSFWNDPPNRLSNLFVWVYTPEGEGFWKQVESIVRI